MRIAFAVSIDIDRNEPEQRETEVYTASELQAPSGMNPIGFIPDGWEDKA